MFQENCVPLDMRSEKSMAERGWGGSFLESSWFGLWQEESPFLRECSTYRWQLARPCAADTGPLFTPDRDALRLLRSAPWELRAIHMSGIEVLLVFRGSVAFSGPAWKRLLKLKQNYAWLSHWSRQDRSCTQVHIKCFPLCSSQEGQKGNKF